MSGAEVPVAKLRPAALVAFEHLQQSLAGLGEESTTTPCGEDPEAFTSDDAGVRFIAARACARCPLVEACGSFAELNAEPAHVWGGRDRTPGTWPTCRACGDVFAPPPGRGGRARLCPACRVSPTTERP